MSIPVTSKEIINGLRHVKRWIKSEPHDDFCGSLTPGHMCDCGKVLCVEQVAAAIKALGA